MSKIVIADSRGIISLLVETDLNFTKAIEIGKNLQKTLSTLIIPSDVFSELINTIGKKFDHKKAFDAAVFILENKYYLIENTTNQIRDSALKKFDKSQSSVSFTDCIVMATADHFITKEIFGFDKVFTQSGYFLPNSSPKAQ